MKPIRSILLISTAILFLFSATYFFQYKKTEFRFTRHYTTSPVLLKEFPIHASNAGIIRAFDDTIYVYDYGLNAIDEYSPAGSLLSKIEPGNKTRSVGLIKNIDIDDVSIKLIDVRNNGILHYNRATREITLDSTGLIYDGIWTGVGSLLFTSFDAPARDISLQTYDETSQRKQVIPSPFKKLHDGALGNSGFFKKCNGKMLYVSWYFGSFYIIDSTIKKLKRVQTIDKYDKPPETISEGSMTFINKQSPTINRDAACDSTFAYIMSNVRSVADSTVSAGSVIVDAYNLQNGSYHHSFVLEKKWGSFIDIFIEGNTLYVLSGKHVQLFKL
jgi:hypothetical protein